MRIARKPVLKSASERYSNAGQNVARPRYGLKLIPHCFIGGEAEDKPLLSFLDVLLSCSVQKTKRIRSFLYFDNLAEIHRPQTGCAGDDRDDLTWRDRGSDIRHVNPAQVKLPPEAECTYGRFECGPAMPDLSARTVVCVAGRPAAALEARLEIQKLRVHEGQVRSFLKLGFDLILARIREAEYHVNMSAAVQGPSGCLGQARSRDDAPHRSWWLAE